MLEHAADLLTLMTWAFSTLGGLVVAVGVWGGKKVLVRLESIEMLLVSEVKTLREMLHEHEIRLVKIESHCQHYHQAGMQPMRRHTDVAPVAFPDYPD